jgi:hypothetical protein
VTTCKATRRDGEPCKAQAGEGSDFCFFHDPARKTEARTVQRRGGQTGKAATLAPKDLKPWRGQAGEVTVLRSPSLPDLVNLLGDTIDDVRVGRLDPRVANSVGYLAGIILKALQFEAFEERLAAIEEAVGLTDGRRL